MMFSYPSKIKKALHANLTMMIGSYGVFLLLCAAFILYFFLEPKGTLNLPPFWIKDGTLAHPLGTTQNGYDLLYLLILAYKNSLIILFSLCLIIALLTFLCSYFMTRFKIVRLVLTLFFDVFMIVPPLLTVMAFSLLFYTQPYLIFFVIGLSYLPHYLENMRQSLDATKQKEYVLADKLEGFSTLQLFFMTILPNLYVQFFSYFIILVTKVFLTLIIVTFFQLINLEKHPDLGGMMWYSLSFYDKNPWLFLGCGILFILTIMCLHLMALGLEKKMN